MKKFKEIIKGNKKYVAAASVIALSFGAVGVLPTLATMNPAAYKVASILGIEKDLGDYSTIVNQMITSKDGTSVGIGEVIYDQQNHKLRIVTYITSPEKIEEGKYWSPFTRVSVNGEGLNQGSRSTTKVIDENTVAFVEDHHLAEELDGKLDINIFIPQVQVNDEIHYNTDWRFAFTVDGSELLADTQVVELGKEVAVNDKESITLVKYTDNALGRSIFFKTRDRLDHTMVEVKGTDNLGNKLDFIYQGGNTAQGGEFSIMEDTISKEATSLTVQVYALQLPEQDGPIEGEYQPVGEAFVIELNQ